MKKVLSIILVISMVLTLMAGCSGNNNAKAKDKITFLATIGTDTLDPVSGGMADHAYNHAVFDTLVKYGETNFNEYRPSLAESWEEASDSMSVTYKLRKDVKFHDGTPFTADDVIYSFDEAFKNPAYAQFRGVIAAYEKVDDYTVKISKVTAYADLNSTLALAFVVVPKELRSKDTAAFGNSPAGTGAYKFVSKDVDGTITLIANEEYFGGAPEIKNAVIKAPIDASTAIVALEKGEVDFVKGVIPSQIPIIEKNKNLDLTEVSSNGTVALFLMTDSLKNDVNLRKAIFHGINRDSVITLAAEGRGEKEKGMFSAAAMGDLVDSVNYVGYDEALAKDYLSKSSYDGKTIKCVVMPTEVPHAQAIQADLTKIGINMEIEQLDINAWSTKVMNGEAEMTVSTTGNIMENNLLSLSITYPYFGKDMQSTDEYENLIVKMNTETDASTRKEIVKKCMQIQYDLANVVSLYEPLVNCAYNKSITGISPASAATSIFYVGDFKLAK